MTQMPEFIEPHAIPEDLAADMARAVAGGDCTPAEAAEALAAMGAVLAEQADGSPVPARAGIDHPGPRFLAPDEQPPLEQHDRPDEPAPVPPKPEQAPPQPLFAGTYAIYDDNDGGVMLVIGQSTGEIVRKHIPAGMIRMAERFGGLGGLIPGL